MSRRPAAASIHYTSAHTSALSTTMRPALQGLEQIGEGAREVGGALCVRVGPDERVVEP